MVSLVAGLLVTSGTVLAVHDLDFQLDGDVDAATTTDIPPGGSIQNVDWSTLFDSLGADITPFPTGFTATKFTRDFGVNPGCLTTGTGTFCTADPSTFTTGSKDTLDINPGWQCSSSANVNSKIDVMNAYAAAYTNPVADAVQWLDPPTNTIPNPFFGTHHKLMYFGMERNTNTGDGNVAFWFLKDGTVGCDSGAGTGSFTGHHQNGDLLVVSAFTKGGGVSGVTAYEWSGGALGTTPVGNGGDCKGNTGGDSICATTNSGPNAITGEITTPWLTANKADGVGHKLQSAEFFEGGIDLTATGLGGACFSTFVGDTRSSQSLTATLFDYAQGTLGACTSGAVTTPSAGQNGTVSIGAGASLSETDSATITTSATGSFGGTVKFWLCGPLTLTSTSNCSAGGVQIGLPLTGETVTGAAGTATVGSDTATITKVGRYCWRAEYSGDTAVGVPASNDPSNTTSVTECFSVTPLTPTLTTSATGSVQLGTAIDDTATLTGTANQPGTGGLGTGGTINPTTVGVAAGGSITFSLYGPSATAVCTAANLIGTSVVTVSGDSSATNLYTASNGTITGTLTPTAVGTYRWIAIYSPDSSGNTLAPSPAGACGDAGEASIITGAASLSTAQRWLPNDTAHITSPAGTTLAGNVTFNLYNSGTCAAPGTAQYGPIVIDVTTGTGSANDRTVSTNNLTFVVTTANDEVAWFWKVSYDDNNLTDPAAHCETTTAFTLAN
jgi:hypothetical protein